jgi:hypothetical protein
MDLALLAPIATAHTPVATVCLDVTHTSEKADTELNLRVRDVVKELSALGAPDATAEAVAGRMLQGSDDPVAGTLRGRAVVADAEGRVLLDQALTALPT